MNHFIAKDDGKYVLFSITFAVVPYVGTWIEIPTLKEVLTVDEVVPYVGTWIEILCGRRTSTTRKVVPYVGTWIEIIWRTTSRTT